MTYATDTAVYVRDRHPNGTWAEDIIRSRRSSMLNIADVDGGCVIEIISIPDCLIIIENTASSAAENALKDTYGNDIMNEKICRKWFSGGGFKKG
ncbi:hypothetical protein ACTXT7_005045 [Hymenolepis weldensis]